MTWIHLNEWLKSIKQNIKIIVPTKTTSESFIYLICIFFYKLYVKRFNVVYSDVTFVTQVQLSW